MRRGKAKHGAASKSAASAPREFASRKTLKARDAISAETKDGATSDLSNSIQALTLEKAAQASNSQDTSPAPEPATATTHPNVSPTTTCAICLNIGRILTCCQTLQAPQTCIDCADMALLLAKHAPDPQHDRQVKEDHIESLKLETKLFEEETERLKGGLEEKKKVLKEKRDELYKMKPDGPKIVKKLGRAKAAAAKRREKM